MGQKRQHFFPRQMQLNFLEKGEGKLWIYDRKLNRYYQLNPKDVALESHIYSLTRPELQEQRFVIEEAMAHLEYKATPAFTKLENGDKITQEEHNLISEYIGYQIVRVPQRLEIIKEMSRRSGQALVEELALGLARLPESKFREANVDPSIQRKDLREMVERGRLKVRPPQDHHLAVMIELATEIGLVFSEKKWVIIHAPSGMSFIGSDVPVVQEAQKGATLAQGAGPVSPGINNFFAFSRKTAILIRDEAMPTIDYARITKKGARTWNTWLARGSDRIIFSHSKALLESLVERNHLGTRKTKIVYNDDLIHEAARRSLERG